MREKADMGQLDWSLAPAGAMWWAPETAIAYEAWYKKCGDGWMVCSRGTGHEWKAIAFPKRNLSELIPRPADPAAEDHRHEQPATAEQTGLPPGTKRVMESPMSNEELRRAIEATAFDLDEPAGYAPGVVDMLKQHLQRLLDIEAARAACMLVEVDDCADAAQGVK